MPADGCCFVNMARCLIGIDSTGSNLLLKIINWHHFLPFFPFILALIHWVGGPDPIFGARWLNASLFGLNIFLFGSLIYKYTDNFWFALIGSLWMLVKIDIIDIHSESMSEPLFIFLMLAWIITFLDFLNTRKIKQLCLCSILAGAACLTRFAGIPLVLTGVVILFLESRQGVLNSKKNAAVFFLLSIFPMLLWLIWNSLSAGNIYDRALGFHPVAIFNLEKVSWPLNPLHFPIISISFNLLMALLGWKMWGKTERLLIENIPSRRIIAVYVVILFIIFYVLLWGITFIFIDAQSVLRRYFIPIEILGLFFLLCCMQVLFHVVKSFRFFKFYLTALLFIYVIGVNSVGAMQWAVSRYQDGADYDGKIWDKSKIIEEVRKIPLDISLYSNNTGVLYLRDHRDSVSFGLISIAEIRSNTNHIYAEFIRRMKEELKNKKARIVYFYSKTEGDQDVLYGLKREMSLKMLVKVADGEIYGWNDQK